MDHIAGLINATPIVFLNVEAKCNKTDKTVDLVCKVDPKCKEPDEVDDMFQSFIDILSCEVQKRNYVFAVLTLERLVQEEWHVFIKINITCDGNNVRIKKTYFDEKRNQHLRCTLVS